MRFGSVCSGIEAASVAWHPLGWEAAWLAEVDVNASQVLAHRLGATAPRHPAPGTEKAIARCAWGDRIVNWGDFRHLPKAVRSGEAEAPEILCGGTPCQAFSVAGRRDGLADARGQLILSFVELADAIDARRAEQGDAPCIVFWEQVPGVLSDKTNAFGCFLAGLVGEDVPLVPAGKRWSDAGIVLGPQRAVAWRVANAEYFGLAQRRRRVFLVASAREGLDPGAILLEFDGLRRDSPPSREARQDAAADARSGAEDDGGRSPWDRPGGVADDPLTAPAWWNGSPVSQTLDAVLHKGQTMPDKNRFPAVLHPVSVALRGREGGGTAELGEGAANALRASGGGGDKAHVLAPIPLLEVGARTGRDGHEGRDGLGVGQPGDPMYSLQASKQHGIGQTITEDVQAVCAEPSYADVPARGTADPLTAKQPVAVAFDIKGGLAPHGGMGASPTAFPLKASDHKEPQVVAFSCKDWGGDAAEEVAPTIRAMAERQGNANGGGQIAVCVTGDVTHTLKAEGFDASEDGTGRGQPIVPMAFQTCGYGAQVGMVAPTLQASFARLSNQVQGVIEPGFIHPRQTRNSQSSNQVGIKPEAQVSDALTSEGPGAVLDAVMPFDTTQITSPHNGAQPKPGNPCHTLLSGAHPPAVAFQEGGRAEGCGVEVGDELAHAPPSPTGRGWAQERGTAHRLVVRRLMPVECERLQGFPDDWTLVPNAKDGPRYKQLGNSWAVPCVRWIGARIDLAVCALEGRTIEGCDAEVEPAIAAWLTAP